MKKQLAFVISLFFLVSLTACRGVAAESEFPYDVYPATAVVVRLDGANDMVTVRSSEGLVWRFQGCSDYECGDVVSLVMEANATPEITDDTILQSRYAGFCVSEFMPNRAGNIQTVNGRFYLATEMQDMEGNIETLYQFRSDDDSVWWLLSAEEISFIPQLLYQEYSLTYDNNGTTPEHKPCDCSPEYECECEVYDDEFLGIFPVSSIERILYIY